MWKRLPQWQKKVLNILLRWLSKFQFQTFWELKNRKKILIGSHCYDTMVANFFSLCILSLSNLWWVDDRFICRFHCILGFHYWFNHEMWLLVYLSVVTCATVRSWGWYLRWCFSYRRLLVCSSWQPSHCFTRLMHRLPLLHNLYQ